MLAAWLRDRSDLRARVCSECRELQTEELERQASEHRACIDWKPVKLNRGSAMALRSGDIIEMEHCDQLCLFIVEAVNKNGSGANTPVKISAIFKNAEGGTPVRVTLFPDFSSAQAVWKRDYPERHCRAPEDVVRMAVESVTVEHEELWKDQTPMKFALACKLKSALRCDCCLCACKMGCEFYDNALDLHNMPDAAVQLESAVLLYHGDLVLAERDNILHLFVVEAMTIKHVSQNPSVLQIKVKKLCSHRYPGPDVIRIEGLRLFLPKNVHPTLTGTMHGISNPVQMHSELHRKATQLPNGTANVVKVDWLGMLHQGDIIEAPHFNFWHHFVVEEVVDDGAIRTIHFGRPSIMVENSVRRDTLVWTENRDEIFLYQFPDADCYPPDEVVAKARRQLNNGSHSLRYNNGIQFALSCKLHDNVYHDYERTISRVRPVVPVAVRKLGEALGNAPVVGPMVKVVGGAVGLVTAPFRAVAGAAMGRLGDNEFVSDVTDGVVGLGDAALRKSAQVVSHIGAGFRVFFS